MCLIRIRIPPATHNRHMITIQIYLFIYVFFLYMIFNLLLLDCTNVIRLSANTREGYPQTNSYYDGCFIFFFSFNKSLHPNQKGAKRYEISLRYLSSYFLCFCLVDKV
jgi:hypothetical protein